MARAEASGTEDRPSLSEALETIRDGVTNRADENERVHTLSEIAREYDVPQQAIAHPKVTQALFRYEFDAEQVRGEIRRGNETYDFGTHVDEVVDVLREAGQRLGCEGQKK
jgi:hypothetical protein